jgi:hypothetical protein
MKLLLVAEVATVIEEPVNTDPVKLVNIIANAKPARTKILAKYKIV